MSRLSFASALCSCVFMWAGLSCAASAQETPPPDSLKFYGHAEGGVAFNTASPSDSENVGNIFTDKANQPQLNQLMAAVERPVDSSADSFDWGFKIQGLFGTDARYTHSLGETDHLIHSKYQFDFEEATVTLHLPALLGGSADVKIGQFPSPMGAETIDASTNSLYSHSYIFNFGMPMKSTGVLTTLHVSPTLDLYAGFDTGLNGGLTGEGDINGTIKGQFGFGLTNLLGGAFSLLAVSHIGDENLPSVTPAGALRYVNDVTAIYKASDALTLTTDVNYIQEDSTHAIGYGVAQYATYVLNDQVTLAARAEVWRDNAGAFVSVSPGFFDSVNSQRGLPNNAILAPRATYGALTLGLTYKPEISGGLSDISIRPELRVDQALNGAAPFNQGKDATSFTPAVDLIVPF